jgi:NADH:ubiquinone oxidoreductase subunit 3 (subunit A)
MKPLDYQPLPLEERQRNKDYPSGLKNIGNGMNFYFIFQFHLYSLLFQLIDTSVFFLAQFSRKNFEL